MIYPARVFEELDSSRFACITGSLSGGKDRLAWELGLYYWRQGYTCLSNTPHNFIGDDRLSLYQDTLYKTYCVVSEGGEYVRKAALASDIVRSAGKADYYVVFAGKRLPHKELQELIIEPKFDFWQNFGIPVILWSCTVNASKIYRFNFWQIFPQRMHGVYSTRTSTGNISDIIKRAGVTVKLLALLEGQEAGEREEAGLSGLADDIAQGIANFS